NKQLQLVTQLNEKFLYYEQELKSISVDQIDDVDVIKSMLNDLFKQYDILRKIGYDIQSKYEQAKLYCTLFSDAALE
ncbi:unnamed protein product, partial [Didymodactylos carnosus]